VVTLSQVAIDRIEAREYTVPTDSPESDGTLEWNSTTLVLVHAYGGGKVGLGYTYADAATATLIRDLLAEVVQGQNALAPRAVWDATVARTRNLGRPGIVSMAVNRASADLLATKRNFADFSEGTGFWPVNGVKGSTAAPWKPCRYDQSVKSI
jgi:hypothetical protein